MTWLHFINMFLLQFLFIRLTRCSRIKVDEYGKFRMMGETPGTTRYCKGVMRSHKEQWFAIQGWIIPFSGWRGKFLYLWQQDSWFVRITPRWRVKK